MSGEGDEGRIKTVKTVFRLIHVNLGCALHGSTQVLPKWYVVFNSLTVSLSVHLFICLSVFLSCLSVH